VPLLFAILTTYDSQSSTAKSGGPEKYKKFVAFCLPACLLMTERRLDRGHDTIRAHGASKAWLKGRRRP